MAKFLHISDVHLGIKRYGLEERTKDFFQAWKSCLEQYALQEQVDFVLIGGDLFDRRQIDPQAANHAIFMLQQLKEAGIPVFAIEGNHDQRENNVSFSWLRSLSQWGFLHLLEPHYVNGQIVYEPWNEHQREGGYIDCRGVRVFGSRWYGANTSNTLPQLYQAMQPHLASDQANILLLHTEIEGYIPRSATGLAPTKLLELYEGLDYIALGHIHKNFTINNWAFNPGSLEATTVDESRLTRGAYLVTLQNIPGAKAVITAELVRNYQQRPFTELTFNLGSYETSAQATEALQAFLAERIPAEVAALTNAQPSKGASSFPLVVLTLTGRLSFKGSLLPLDEIREKCCRSWKILDLIYRNETELLEYAAAPLLGAAAPRNERELQVLESLVSQHPRYRHQSRDLAQLILEVKRQVLAAEPTEALLSTLENYTAQQVKREALHN
jgi:DNA repair protein SbcD/Mre11